MYLEEATFVVTDTETTGLKPGGARVIEIGAVKVRNGQIVGRFNSLVNPGHHVPRRITRLTGITTPMVFAAPPASEVLPRYLEFLDDGILVGHNVAFDKKFIQHELRRAGLQHSLGPALCTMRMARRLLHALPSKSLQSLKRHYSIRTARRHRALDDAEATAEVFLRLVTSLRNESGMSSVAELLRYQNQRLYTDRSVPANVRRIRDGVLHAVPNVPGVYLFKSAANVLVYVGKARDLNARVRTYFSGIDSHPYRIRQLVKAVRDIDFIPTNSELSALILESRLIKRYKPTFNRAEIRYRNLPFLRFEPSETPALKWSYEIRNDSAEYFGPLGNRRQADKLVEIVAGVFGPGGGLEDAGSQRVRAFLTEGQDDVIHYLQAKMLRSAEALAFEEAARYRDHLSFLERLREKRPAIASSVLDHHAVWVHRTTMAGAVTLYLIRHGRLAAEVVIDEEKWEGMRPFVQTQIAKIFWSSEPTPDRYGKHEIDEIRIIAAWLHRVRDSIECVPIDTTSPKDSSIRAVLDVVSDACGQAGSDVASSNSSGVATLSRQALSE